MISNRIPELLIILLIVLTGLYLINPKVGVFLGLLTGILALCILLITLFLERLEKSKVPRSFFFAMAAVAVIGLSFSGILISLFGSPFYT